MATCGIEYDKIQTLGHSPLCDDQGLGGVACGEGTGMALNSAFQPDHAAVAASNENVRDVFEWGDSNFSIHSSEISQVSESLFESMRSGYDFLSFYYGVGFPYLIPRYYISIFTEICLKWNI